MHMKVSQILHPNAMYLSIWQNDHILLSLFQIQFLPNSLAAWCISSVPKRLIIWQRQTRSSQALKNGYRPDSKDRNITPADQMSTAAVIAKKKKYKQLIKIKSTFNSIKNVLFLLKKISLYFSLERFVFIIDKSYLWPQCNILFKFCSWKLKFCRNNDTAIICLALFLHKTCHQWSS